jgi:hypothetical protein
MPAIVAATRGWAKKTRVAGETRRPTAGAAPAASAAQISMAIPMVLKTTSDCALRIGCALKAAAPAGPIRPTNAP